MRFILFFYVSFLLSLNAVANNDKIKITNLNDSHQVFVGRKKEFHIINNELFSKNILTLTGFGGIGKSQIVKNYIQQSDYKYNIIWWIDSDRDVSLQLRNLAIIIANKIGFTSTFDERTNSVLYLKDYFENTNLNWVMIFDNASNYNSISAFIPKSRKQHNKSHILITSRNSTGWHNFLKIQKLSQEASLKLINTLSETIDKVYAKRLAKIMDGYPLPIVQAVSFIKYYPSMSLKKYVDMYNEKRSLLMNQERDFYAHEKDAAPFEYLADTATTIKISFQALKDQHPDSAKLLNMISLISSTKIPNPLMEEYIAKHSNVQLPDILYPLLKYSFLSQEESGAEFQYYFIHDIVKEHVKQNLSLMASKQIVRDLAKILYAKFNLPRSKLIDYVSNNPEILDHTELLLKNTTQYNFETPETMYLRTLILEYYLSGKRDYQKGKEVIDELNRKISSPPFGISIENQTRFLANKVNYYMWKADYKLGEEVGLEAIKNYEKHHNTSEEYYRLVTYVAYIYNMQGESEKALNLPKKFKKNLTLKNSPYLFSIYLYVKSSVLFDMAKYRESLDLQRQCIDISNKNNFAYSSYYHREVQELRLLNSLRDPTKTLTLSKQILDRFRNNKIELTHETVGRVKLAQAEAEFYLNNFTQAKIYLNEAENVFKIWYQGYGKHRNQAFMYFIKGKICVQENNHDLALKYFKKAEGIYSSVFSNMNVAEVLSLYENLLYSSVKTNDFDMSREYMRKLKNIYGSDNQKTILLLRYLAKSGVKL